VQSARGRVNARTRSVVAAAAAAAAIVSASAVSAVATWRCHRSLINYRSGSSSRCTRRVIDSLGACVGSLSDASRKPVERRLCSRHCLSLPRSRSRNLRPLNVSAFVCFQVNPDARDRTTQQIQSKLGNYSLVKHLLDEPKRLIGIDGIPSPILSPQKNSSGNSRSCSPSSVQEFKKPGGLGGSSSSSSSAGHQRCSFVKPADGKPPYGGRSGYPGQPAAKHGGNGNDHRSHGLLGVKGPPPPSQPTNSPAGTAPPIGNSGSGPGSSTSSLPNRSHFAGRLKLIDVNVSIDLIFLFPPLSRSPSPRSSLGVGSRRRSRRVRSLSLSLSLSRGGRFGRAMHAELSSPITDDDGFSGVVTD